MILKIWAIVSAHYYDNAYAHSRRGVQGPSNLQWDLSGVRLLGVVKSGEGWGEEGWEGRNKRRGT